MRSAAQHSCQRPFVSFRVPLQTAFRVPVARQNPKDCFADALAREAKPRRRQIRTQSIAPQAVRRASRGSWSRRRLNAGNRQQETDNCPLLFVVVWSCLKIRTENHDNSLPHLYCRVQSLFASKYCTFKPFCLPSEGFLMVPPRNLTSNCG